MKHVVEQARKLAMLSSAPLLITGDTGNRQESFRLYLSPGRSPRSAKPISGAQLRLQSRNAVESELFGHAPEGKKAFEQANGGSVLLD